MSNFIIAIELFNLLHLEFFIDLLLQVREKLGFLIDENAIFNTIVEIECL